MFSFLKKKSKRKLWFNVVFLLVLPFVSVLLVLVLVYAHLNLRLQDQAVGIPIDKDALTPGVLLADKSDFANKAVALRGRVVKEPAVCQKKDCPQEDPCCGCPKERDLVIYDEGTNLGQSVGGRLQLLNPEGASLCSRQTNSCDYQCGDWLDGGIYQVSGVFFYKKPPPGWSSSLEYHFVVEDKKLLGEVGWGQRATNLWQEIIDSLKGIFSSGGYVIP